MNEQEILSKITFIKLVQPNYIGDGLELKQGDTALVSNEKCYQVMNDFPDKFERIDFKDIPVGTYKTIYDNRNKLVEKDDGQLIFDTNLFDLLIENPLKFREYSEKTTQEKQDLPEGFDEKLAEMIFEKESEKLWRDSHSRKKELLNHNRNSMGNLPSESYTTILEVYIKLLEKLVNLKFEKDKVVLKKSNIALNSNIHPFLIQRIETLIHQWVNTSKVIIQELLPRSGDVDLKNFLISQLKENAKNINSNFKRDLDIDLHLSNSMEEHSSFLSYLIRSEIIIIGSITGISVGGIAGIGAGVATFIGTIASIVAILSFFGIKPTSV